MSSTLRPARVLVVVLLCSGCTTSETANLVSVGEPPPNAAAAGQPEPGLVDRTMRESDVVIESDVFIDRYCGRLRNMCWRWWVDVSSAPPDTDPSACAETLRTLSKAPGTSFDSRLAKACEEEVALWSVSLSCGGVFKVTQPRSPGSTCSVDAECANLGDAVGLCVASPDDRRCALVKRGNVGDACVGTSGTPLAVRSTFEGAICMHQEGLFCDPTGRCAPRRRERESCRRDPRRLGSSVDCADDLWCIDGSCVSRETLIDDGIYCPPDAETAVGCGRPIGDSCSEYLLGGVPVSDCLGVCMAHRCTDHRANAKAAACMGFTSAHSFDF